MVPAAVADDQQQLRPGLRPSVVVVAAAAAAAAGDCWPFAGPSASADLSTVDTCRERRRAGKDRRIAEEAAGGAASAGSGEEAAGRTADKASEEILAGMVVGGREVAEQWGREAEGNSVSSWCLPCS